MQTKSVSIEEAAAHLANLLAIAANEKIEIIITKDDKPLGRLLPLANDDIKRGAGLHRGKIKMSDDFNEPLSDDFWLGKE